jgi:hypothetical protein
LSCHAQNEDQGRKRSNENIKICFSALKYAKWSEDFCRARFAELNIAVKMAVQCLCVRAPKLVHAITSSYMEEFSTTLMSYLGTDVHETSCHAYEGHWIKGQGHLR